MCMYSTNLKNKLLIALRDGLLLWAELVTGLELVIHGGPSDKLKCMFFIITTMIN